jgi:hypothetical protein
MIPVHELRIGNWMMNDSSGTYHQLQTGVDLDQHSSSFSPILITPEILAKCGFAFHEYFKLWQKNKKTGGTGPDMEMDPDYWVLDFSHRRIGV